MTAAAVLSAARLLDPEGAALLERALDPLSHSVWPDVAWSFSGLTVDGGPVELGFSTHDRMMRATLEVAGPECPNAERLDAAVQLLGVLGLPMPDPSHVADWRRLQTSEPLRFGCWLGLRIANGRARGKLYVEVPRSSDPSLPGATVQMLGYDPASDLTELYGSIDHPTRPLMDNVLGTDAEPMLGTLADLIGRPVSGMPGWIGLGLSVAAAPNTRPRYAVFCRAWALAGGAGRLRKRFAYHPGYQALLGAIPDHALPDHGIVTVIAGERGGIEVRAAVSATAIPRQ